MARELAERLEQRDVEIASDHPGRHEHALRRLAQSLDAPSDEPAHALRKLEVFFREAGLLACSAFEHALRLRHVEEGVLDKKRIAFAGGLDAEQLHRRQRRFGQAGDDALDIMVRQAAEHETLRAAAPEQAGEDGGDWPTRVQLRVPTRAEDDNPASVDALGEVAKEHHRRFIRPLQVVEHDQHRLVRLHAGEEAVDRFEELLANFVGRDLVSGRHAADLLPQARHERREQGTVAPDGFIQHLGCGARDPPGQYIPEGSIRLAVLFERAAGQYEPALGRRIGGDLGCQPRRPDAWSAGQEDE